MTVNEALELANEIGKETKVNGHRPRGYPWKDWRDVPQSIKDKVLNP